MVKTNGSLEMVPITAANAENNSLFVDSGDSNKLKHKDNAGSSAEVGNGSRTLIATKTAVTAALVEFDTSEITADYEYYEVVFHAVAATGQLQCQVALGDSTYEVTGYYYIQSISSGNQYITNDTDFILHDNIQSSNPVMGKLFFNRGQAGLSDKFLMSGELTSDLIDDNHFIRGNQNSTGILNKIKFISSGGNFSNGKNSFSLYGVNT